MKLTRRQLRRLIREQFGSRRSTYEAPRREFDEGQKLPLKDKGTGISSGEGMEREMVIETMKLIQKWRNLTRKHDLTDRHGEATFDSYVDSAFKTVQGKIYNNDYSVPYDLPGLSEMKITRSDLRRMILEQMSDYHDLEPTTDLQPRSLSLERMPELGEMPKQVAVAVIQKLGANPIRQTVASSIPGSLLHAPEADVGEAPIWPGSIELEIFDQIEVLGVDSDDPIVDDLYGSALLEIEKQLGLPPHTL